MMTAKTSDLKRLVTDITREPNARILRAVLEGRNSGTASAIELN
jgi:hypothetical protein